MRSSLLFATLLLTACTTGSEIDELRSVLPDERLAVDDAALTGGLARGAGEPSEWYAITVDGISDVNSGLVTMLVDLQTITSFEPSWEPTARTATWGPWLDDGLWLQLWVRAESDGTYVWAMDARPEDSDASAFERVIEGHVDAGANEEASLGTVAIDYDAVDGMGGGDGETGRAAIAYALSLDGADVTVGLGEFADDGSVPADGAVHYTYDRDGGVMDWAIEADGSEPPNGSIETWTVRSRWDATGAGRTDAVVTGGDVGPLTFTETDCWDTSHTTVFYENNLELRREGDASACAFR